ncbi:MAG TPA: inositol monophosphatase family protein [Armatimonadota bacterium]|jgi:myo-inositol-1(or 4)-monophosphatase
MAAQERQSEVLAEVVQVAHAAGAAAQKWFGRVNPTQKADGSLASEADLEAEAYLMEHLGKLFPGDEICSEETPQHRCVGTGRVWSLDPVDGTHNFIAGLGVWAVSMGLLEHGRPALGVVYSPPLGLTFAAERGAGAWLNDQKLAAVRSHPMERNDLVGINTDMPDWLPRLPGKCRNLGSAALHACWAATGVFRAAFFHNWVLWDVAAALCLAGETGVETYWPDGQVMSSLEDMEVSERQGLLVMAPPALAAPLLAEIQAAR